ncbi:AAA family ATPase [Pseudomonas piscis]|uniref:AAA family ATPase n=1 Tax=Pseudomonas piscis TaxID=2614538 RepID=UPI00385063FE
MEYDEGREITRLIAEEMISVASGFPNISPEMVKILAALHLTKGLILEDRYRYIFNEACSEVAERCLKEYDDADIRAALNAKLEQLRDDHALPLDRDIRVKTATYLIDRYIMDNYNISYDHPAAVGALVGSIHLSLRSPLIEFTPITGELSMAMHKTQTSVTMLYPRSTTLRALITLKLIINKIFANFIHGQIPDVITGTQPSYLFDSGQQISFEAATGVTSLASFAKKHPQPARFMFVIPATNAQLGSLLKNVSPALQEGLRLDAIICFSITEERNPKSDQIMLVFSQGIHMMLKPHLYIDVSRSNKSLEQLDTQERAILAGQILNIHESSEGHDYRRNLPTKVATIINAQFGEGYRNVKTLCLENEKLPEKPLKVYSPRNFILKNNTEGSTFNSTANPQIILELLRDSVEPVCIYIIGNNGAGKTRLLCDLIERMRDMGRSTVGISTGIHDRFPFGRSGQSGHFKYQGARSTSETISPSKLRKTVTAWAAQVLGDQRMLEAFKECQQCLGFATRFYFMLKPEMALHNAPGDIRLIRMSDNADDNHVPEPLSHYEFGVVRPGNEETRERIVSYSSLSSGEQNINQLLLSIITTAERGTVFLVDEPEISLHLKWQQTLPRVFHLLSQRFGCSFVVATHAPILISNANDLGSHSFMLDLGTLPELTAKQRYSVESIILGGFGIYTPHNRAVHEACARIVAKAMDAQSSRQSKAFFPLEELDDMLEKMKVNQGAYVPPGQQEDIDLINKAYTAVQLLLKDQGLGDSANSKAGE